LSQRVLDSIDEVAADVQRLGVPKPVFEGLKVTDGRSAGS